MASDGLAIPGTATAALLNITIDGDATQNSFLTVWPANESRPFASVNNALPGLIAANSMLAQPGNGAIRIYNRQGEVTVIIDLVGYTVPLSSVAPTGSGGNILAGDTAPANTLGSNGDFYIDVVHNILYGPKKNGAWPTTGISLAGTAGATGAPGGAGPEIATGIGAPATTLGAVGDLYIDTATGTLWAKSDSGWTSKGSIQSPAGTNGTNGLPGTNGINGADGSKILTGTVAPLDANGNIGDVSINTTSGALYAKTGIVAPGVWTANGSIQGPTGPIGPTGPTGPMRGTPSQPSPLPLRATISSRQMSERRSVVGSWLRQAPGRRRTVVGRTTRRSRWEPASARVSRFSESAYLGWTPANIGLPGFVSGAAANAAVTLQCQVNTLLTVNSRTQLTATITAVQVGALTAPVNRPD